MILVCPNYQVSYDISIIILLVLLLLLLLTTESNMYKYITQFIWMLMLNVQIPGTRQNKTLESSAWSTYCIVIENDVS